MSYPPANDTPRLGIIGADDEAFISEQLAPTMQAHTEAKVEVLPGSGHLDIASDERKASTIGKWF
ncbi:MAG: hypothetical protein OSB70_14690 [Myxococcota bacterium]|nr:hypothetical protein [Myxococcota bacterium]